MSEQERFEQRLRAALRDHTASSPTGFDAAAFAHEVASRAPRRHGLFGDVSWHHDPIPRQAWTVLLVGVLLTALVVGALTVGAALRRQSTVLLPVPLSACPAGRTPDEPGPVDQARPPEASLFTPVAVDVREGRLVAAVEPPGTAATVLWGFDLCTNTWAKEPGSGPGGGDLPGQIAALAYDVAAGLLIGFDGEAGVPWTYDASTGGWTRGSSPRAAFVGWGNHPRVVDDPRGSGVIVVFDGSVDPDVLAFDPGTDTWTTLSSKDDPITAGVAFDAALGRLVVVDMWDGTTPRTVRLLDPATGGWTTSNAASPNISYGWEPPNVADTTYDERGHRVIVFNMGRMLAYDGALDAWATLYDAARDAGVVGNPDGVPIAQRVRWRSSIAWDPVNHRVVVYGGAYLRQTGADVAWTWYDGVDAFDPATGRWTTLLAPSGGTPPASIPQG